MSRGANHYASFAAICFGLTMAVYVDLHSPQPGERGNPVDPADATWTLGERVRVHTVALGENNGKLHHPLPPPTEHWLDEGAESRNKARRKAWMKRMHRAPEGVDSVGIERENGSAQIAKRNALAATPPPSPKADQIVPVWVERGSDNQAGRMMVARHGTDDETLYGGSAKGGVWKGSMDGEDWTPIGDNLYGGAHWLEITAPDADGDPDIVLAATDWGSMHYSEDDGETWTIPTMMENISGTRRLIQMSDGSEIIFAIVYEDSQYNLKRSEDGGRSFETLWELPDYGPDVWVPRDGGSDVYVLWDNVIFKSEDYGDNWTEQGSIGSGANEGQLVGSEAGAPTLYAVLGGSWIWRSDDAGESWAAVQAISDYWGSVNTSSINPDFLVWGGVDTYHSLDGAETVLQHNTWGEYYSDPANYLHADIPGIDVAIDVDGNEIIYICTDGGLYRSTDYMASVENLSLKGLRVSQYYSTLTSTKTPDHIAGGTQDQGYQITNGVEQDDDSALDFDQIISGDYGHLTSSDGDHDWVYSVYPGFILIQIGEVTPSLAYLSFPSSESYVPWLPPIVADPDEERAFFFPATRIYRYEFVGNGWETTIWSEQDFAYYSDEYVSVLAFSPVDPNRAYAATSYGRVYYSDDKGVTWTQSQSMVADENWLYGQAIAPSVTDPDIVTIGGSGYGVPAVYRSEDGGVSFAPWSDGLPDTLVYSLEEAPDGSGRVVAGTESSAYLREADGEQWEDITGNDAPVTTYWSVEALTEENTLRFGTYGRGIWDYQLDPDHLGCYPVQDYDADGADCEADCDDHDDEIFPGQVEICSDGIDQDCDGVDLLCTETLDPTLGETEQAEPESEAPVEEEPVVLAAEGRCGCAVGSASGSVGALLWVIGAVTRRRRD